MPAREILRILEFRNWCVERQRARTVTCIANGASFCSRVFWVLGSISINAAQIRRALALRYGSPSARRAVKRCARRQTADGSATERSAG